MMEKHAKRCFAMTFIPSTHFVRQCKPEWLEEQCLLTTLGTMFFHSATGLKATNELL